MTAINTSQDQFVRRVLHGNITFTMISCVTFLTAGGILATLFGVNNAGWIIRMVGLALLPFAGFVYWVASRPKINPAMVWVIAAADALWVIGTAVILVTNAFGLSAAGNWVLLGIADIVAAFAILEYMGLRRMK